MTDSSGEQRTLVRILGTLDSKGIQYALYSYSARSIREAGESPIPLALIAKTVALHVKDMGLVLAVLPAADRVDFRKVAQALDVDRSKIVLATPNEVFNTLDCAYGNVSPIDPSGQAIVLVDIGLSSFPAVYCGAGADGRTLGLRFADLVGATNARCLDLARR